MEMFSLLNKSLCALSKYLFFFFIINFFPLLSQRSFIGYKPWQGADPKIVVHLKKNETDLRYVKVSLKCQGAKEFQISHDRNFTGARWRKMAASIKWYLKRDKDIVSIWVVFKRQNLDTGLYEITKPIAYTIHRKEIYKKITMYPQGYVDWSEGKMIIKAIGEKSKENQSRYDLFEAQGIAQKKIVQFSYELLKVIPWNYFYTIGEFLKVNRIGTDNLNQLLELINLKEIKHPSPRQVELVNEMPFYPKKEKPGIGSMLKRLQADESLTIGTNTETIFKALLLDVRGLDFYVAIHPQIFSDNSQEVINTFYYTNNHQVYARYISRINTNYVNQFLTVKEVTNKSAQTNKNNNFKTLYVKAIDVDPSNKSKIIITDRYRRLIQGNLSSLYNICNGGLFIIVD